MTTALGFDYGQNKTGVAAGQTTTGTAEPLETIAASGDSLHQRVDSLIGEWKPDAIVIGIPLPADGSTDSPMCRAVRAFGDRIEKAHGLPVHYIDEHLTSDAAARAMRETLAPGKKLSDRKKRSRDAIAAQLILLTWLNEQA